MTRTGRAFIALISMTLASTAWSAGNSYADLLSLFAQWQVFEHPPLREGVPDYTAESMARSLQQLKEFQGRLAAIDSTA